MQLRISGDHPGFRGGPKSNDLGEKGQEDGHTEPEERSCVEAGRDLSDAVPT